MKKKHTIDIKPDANDLSFMLDKSNTRRELFDIAEHIGASKKGDKWYLGMKAHVGADAGPGLLYRMETMRLPLEIRVTR